MHNQNRAEYKARLADPAVAAKLAAKASQWNALTNELASRRAASATAAAPADPSSAASTSTANATPGTTLQLIEKLLTVNPDPSHLWNHRRELLLLPGDEESRATQHVADPGADPKCTATNINFVLNDELKLTATCLQRNPKSYGAWFHRKWTVRHWLLQSASTTTEEQRSVTLQTELGLCASFLDKDERNFHCWNYRRFVVAAMLDLPVLAATADDGNVPLKLLDGSWKLGGTIMGPQLASKDAAAHTTTASKQQPRPSTSSADEVVRSEFEYTTKRIEKNFSNCSAFHYRSKLIDLVLDMDLRDEGISRNEEGEAYQTRLDMAKGELETIQSAVFTEPDDQTAWWYHRFVVAWARPAPTANWTDQDAASEAIDMFTEVLEEEKESIQELVDAEGGQCKWGLLALHMLLSELNKLDNFSDEDRAANKEESNGCLDQLSVLDPDRATRYKSMRR